MLALAVAACTTTDETPSTDELDELDSWAATADGKADLPSAWHEVVAWLRDVYTNDMSAIWHGQEHPRTAEAAITRIRAIVSQAGVADPTRLRFRASVRRLRAELIDHSEINVTLPGGTVIRLVGDPKGAGAFFDYSVFKDQIGPSLCLTWPELEKAVEAAYAPGLYGSNFVCHTVTERVLRALDVGATRFAAYVRTYQAARFVWGPLLPSFDSTEPSQWAVSRSCD